MPRFEEAVRINADAAFADVKAKYNSVDGAIHECAYVVGPYAANLSPRDQRWS